MFAINVEFLFQQQQQHTFRHPLTPTINMQVSREQKQTNGAAYKIARSGNTAVR